MRSVFVLLVALIGSSACDMSEDDLRYELVLFGDDGAVVTTGRLILAEDLRPQSSVAGTYVLADSGLTPNSSGRLQATCMGGGETDEDILQIRLDLDVADAGVLLEGTCLAGLTGGEWSQITIAGSVPGGRFELSR